MLQFLKKYAYCEPIVCYQSHNNGEWPLHVRFGAVWKGPLSNRCVKIRKKLFRHMPEARQSRHSHPPYLYKWTCLFLDVKSQMIRICNVEMKIWRCTPSSGAFSKWFSWRWCRKTKSTNFRISTSNYQRYTQFISWYMFLRMTNTVILVKNTLHIKKHF